MTDILATFCALFCTHDGPHIFQPRPPLTDDEQRRIDRDESIAEDRYHERRGY